MPIKDKSVYSKNWKELRATILERAHNTCEWPLCHVPNGETIYRYGKTENWNLADDGIFDFHVEATDPSSEPRLVKVILTIAHLDHDPANNDPSNLKALCQLHHLRLDAGQHATNAAQTRASKRYKAIELTGQTTMKI